MLVLNCKIEFEGERKWTLNHVNNIKIERNSESLMDWCEIELPSKIRWDQKRDCPLKRGDKVTIWLGYGNDLELAFKGLVLQIYNLEKLVIYCGDEMQLLRFKEIQNGTLTTKWFIEVLKKEVEDVILGDEKIDVGQIYFKGVSIGFLLSELYSKYRVRSGFVIKNDKARFYFGNVNNESIRAVFDLEGNVIKNGLKKNRAIDTGIHLVTVSNDARNKKYRVGSYFGAPPYKKVFYRYYGLTEDELKKEHRRLEKEYYFRNYSGTLTVFGGRLIEKFDLVGIKENGEKRGVYEVVKNIITFGINGYRQTITIGNEKEETK